MSVTTNLVQIQIQTDQIFTEKKYCCGYCRRNPRLFLLFTTILIWGSLISSIYFGTRPIWDKPGPEIIPFIFSIIVCGFTYINYLLQAFCYNKTLKYLLNIKASGKNDILTYVEQIKASPPVISMSCQCYHFETRTRLVTENYGEYVNGQYVTRTSTRTEVYQEIVVTYTGYEVFHHREWLDVSGSLSNELYNHNVVRIDFSKTWTAGDQQTQAAFNYQYDEFKRKYEHRDTYFSSSYDISIQNYKPFVLSVIKEKWYLSWGAYVIATIFLSSIFYRYWFDRHSVKGNFEFKKIVKI